ncbi:unnamed protein product, partial [Symbiodinium pilosum]
AMLIYALLLLRLSEATVAAQSLRRPSVPTPREPEPVEGPTIVGDGPEVVVDSGNHSLTVENIISCRFGVLCHGEGATVNGTPPICNGSLVCSSERLPADDHRAESYVQMMDAANTTVAVGNLLVCRYGSYCRGGWWWYDGRRECRGGVVCRRGPYYLDKLDTDTNAGGQSAAEAVSAVPTNYTTMQTGGASNETELMACRYGSYCRGGWWFHHGHRECRGGIVCRSGPRWHGGGWHGGGWHGGGGGGGCCPCR